MAKSPIALLQISYIQPHYYNIAVNFINVREDCCKDIEQIEGG